MHVPTEEDIKADRRRRLRKVGAISVALTLTLGMAACGDDDEDAATTTTEDASTDTTADEPAGGGEGDLVAFCDAIIEVDATFAAGGPEGPDPTRLQSAFQEAQSTAPADIAADVEEIITLIQETASNPDQEPPAELEELDTSIDEYVVGNCDFAEVEVTGTEYSFEGLSEPIAAGQTTFNLANEGGEQHEVVVVRINDDVTAPIEELAQLPDEEVFSMIEVKGFAFAPPGETDQTFADLEPGRYGALCFLPVGSTPEAAAAAEESGEEIDAPPHFTQGMIAEFTVE